MILGPPTCSVWDGQPTRCHPIRLPAVVRSVRHTTSFVTASAVTTCVCEDCTRQLVSPGNAHQPVYSVPHRDMNHIFVPMCSAADLDQWLSLSLREQPGCLTSSTKCPGCTVVSPTPAFASPLVHCRVTLFTIFISLPLLFNSPSLSVWQITTRYSVSHPVCPQAVYFNQHYKTWYRPAALIRNLGAC